MRQLTNNELNTVAGGLDFATCVKVGGAYLGYVEGKALATASVTSFNWAAGLGGGAAGAVVGAVAGCIVADLANYLGSKTSFVA